MAAPSRYDLVINLAYPTDRKPWLGAPIVTLLRSLILNPAAIWAIGCVLLAWFLGSAAIALIGCRRLITELRAARERITETADSIAFARDYESVSDMLSALRILGPRWREFRDSLLVPETGGRPVSATVPANAWFELSPLLRAAGLDPRYHGALPNLLVGAGLLFTFAGLAAALGSAGDIVTEAASQAARNQALQKLLDAASFKFITSLVGLSLSIAYALV